MVVSGTLYERGVQMGKAFRTTIQEEMEAVKELWKDPDIQDRFLIVKQKLEDH